MIDTAARASELVQQYVAAVPAHTVEWVRRAHSVILADPAPTSSSSAPSGSGSVPTVNPSAPPGSEKIMTVIGWVGWGVFAASIAGVLFICIKMATSAHKTRMGDGGGEEAGKLFWPLLACIVGSSAGALLGAVS